MEAAGLWVGPVSSCVAACSCICAPAVISAAAKPPPSRSTRAAAGAWGGCATSWCGPVQTAGPSPPPSWIPTSSVGALEQQPPLGVRGGAARLDPAPAALATARRGPCGPQAFVPPIPPASATPTNTAGGGGAPGRQAGAGGRPPAHQTGDRAGRCGSCCLPPAGARAGTEGRCLLCCCPLRSLLQRTALLLARRHHSMSVPNSVPPAVARSLAALHLERGHFEKPLTLLSCLC